MKNSAFSVPAPRGRRLLMVLTAAFLLTVLFILPAGAEVDAVPLTLNEEATAVISSGGQIAYFSFTPVESGTYIFTSSSNDTQYKYGYLYNSSLNQLCYDYGSYFQVIRQLTAGTRYYFGTKYYSSSSTGSFQVKLTKDNFAWSLNDGVLTITGPGPMPNYSTASPPWYSSRSSIQSVVIEDSVTSIGHDAFHHCFGLTSVSIPNSVTSIGSSAFYNCTGLTSVTIPSSVTSIGSFAFYGCYGLTSITVSSGNNNYCSIDGVLFNKTKTNLIKYPAKKAGSSYTIPDSVTSIGRYAFDWCTGLTSVTIPDSVTSIGDSAFFCCSSLTSITIPDSVTSIREYAFCGCSSLTSVTIPDSVTYIVGGIFSRCSGLTSITIPDSVTYIDDSAFSYCDNLTHIIAQTCGSYAYSWAVSEVPDLYELHDHSYAYSWAVSAGFQVDVLHHEWNAPEYTWAEDNRTITAKRVCIHYASHIETETVSVTAEITAPATCENMGQTTYTSDSFTNKAFSVQTKTLTDIDALRHEWSEPEYTWADDNTSVTAVRVCAHDETHIETETVSVTAEITKAATCEEMGQTTYTAVFENEAFETQTRTLTDVEALGHEWGEPEYTWADDNTSVTATRVCAHDEAHVETETVPVMAEVTKTATCEEMGQTTYTSAAFKNAAFSVQTKTLTNIDALGHEWGEPEYTWSEDNKSVTASRVCAHDETHIETETVSVTAEVTKAATCEEIGQTTYTAVFENEAFETQTRTLTDVEALGHEWGEPEYTWADDNTSVTATRVCAHDASHTETETVSVTAAISRPATCEEMGQTTYTSAAFKNAAFSVQTKTLTDIDALGHEWGEPEYTWSEDNKSVTAVRVCAHDETHIETETVSVTAEVTKAATCEEMGQTTYTAVFENEAFETQTRILTDVDALGHEWGAPAYTWSADNSKVTATRVCAHDASHTETETVSVTAAISRPATCEEMGQTTYTSAAFKNTAFSVQTKTLTNIDALGHEWGEPEYTWSEDNKSVTAVRVCAHDETHIETETVSVTAEVTKAATCEEMGQTTYTAIFENEAFETQTRTLTDVKALGHEWGEPEYTWADG